MATMRSLIAHVVLNPLLLFLAASAICSAQSQPANPNPEANPFYAKLGPPWKLYYGGKLDEAAAGFRHVLEEAAAAGDQQAQGWSYVALGMVMDAKAHYPAALHRILSKPFVLFEIVKDKVDAAHTHGHLGNCRVLYGRHGSSSQTFPQRSGDLAATQPAWGPGQCPRRVFPWRAAIRMGKS